MRNLIEIIPSFEIQLGEEIDPDLFDQVRQIEKQRNLFLREEISFQDYCDAIAIACNIDEYLDEIDNRLD
jgi:hypothetical protein